MAGQECPLCHVARSSRKFKPLYGTPVCHKCYYGFANRRQIGFAFDTLVFLACVTACNTALEVLGLLAHISPSAARIVLPVLAWIVYPLVFFLKDGFAGFSPGKFFMGVRAVDVNTREPIGFVASLKRNLPLFIPFIWVEVGSQLMKGHRLGDGWARSKVVWNRYANHRVFTGLFACAVCQYDLRGNTSSICPECGTPVPGSDATHHCARCDRDLTSNTTGACPGCGAEIIPPMAPPVLRA